jgi:hypothetical protein
LRQTKLKESSSILKEEESILKSAAKVEKK